MRRIILTGLVVFILVVAALPALGQVAERSSTPYFAQGNPGNDTPVQAQYNARFCSALANAENRTTNPQAKAALQRAQDRQGCP